MIITSYSPGTVARTNNLTMTGTDLDTITSVGFLVSSSYAYTSTFVSQSPTSLVIVVPNNADIATYQLSFSTGGSPGASGPTITVTAAPASLTATPARGIPGTLISVTHAGVNGGSNFTIGGLACTINAVESGVAQITVPIGARTGLLVGANSGIDFGSVGFVVVQPGAFLASF